MPDREKVISTLEEIKTQTDEIGLDSAVIAHKFIDKILALLKKQEAVPVIQREIMHMLFWCCGSCGVAITDGDKFCRHCGKALNWDGKGTTTITITDELLKPTTFEDLGYVQVVRCKDCKWYDEQISICNNCGLPREQTFFCADGKRR